MISGGAVIVSVYNIPCIDINDLSEWFRHTLMTNNPMTHNQKIQYHTTLYTMIEDNEFTVNQSNELSSERSMHQRAVTRTFDLSNERSTHQPNYKRPLWTKPGRKREKNQIQFDHFT